MDTRQIRQQLASPETLRLILDNMVDGVVVANSAGRFILFNKRAEEICGRTATDANMTMWAHHFGIYKCDQVTLCPTDELPMPRAIRGETIDQEEAFIRNDVVPDGVWVSINATPLKDECGNIIGGVGVFRDITQQKQAAQELRESALRLEQSHRELQSLAFAVSHELQPPLGTVTSYLNLLSIRYKDRLGADADEFIDKVVSGSKMIERMLNDLWFYARVNTSELNNQHVSCTGLLDEVLEESQIKIAETQAQVEREILPLVTANKSQLRYLFKCLLDNAIDFRRPGAPPVIRYAIKERADMWEFAVEDNGVGIAQEEFIDIFKLFYRIGNKPEPSRTGMGLAISRKIVEEHGGQLWLTSTPGQGSTFYFTWPKTT